MEESLECPICLDLYGDSLSAERSPRCLTCGDTLCKQCPEEITNYSQEEFFMCPLCKGEIKKEQNINKYIPNKAIINSVNSIFNNPENEEVFIRPTQIKREIECLDDEILNLQNQIKKMLNK